LVGYLWVAIAQCRHLLIKAIFPGFGCSKVFLYSGKSPLKLFSEGNNLQTPRHPWIKDYIGIENVVHNVGFSGGKKTKKKNTQSRDISQKTQHIHVKKGTGDRNQSIT